jgi:small subunit ribosomal protein S6
MVFSVKDGEEGAQALKTKFTDLISKNGTLGEIDEWGKRKLAYPINKEPEGYYCVVNYEAEPTFPAELDRVFGITDGAMRLVTIKKGE